MSNIDSIIAVNCPKFNKLISINDCEHTNCPFFNFYTFIKDEIREVNCSFVSQLVLPDLQK